MTATLASLDDLDLILLVLTRRREAIVRHAPLFWRPAPVAQTRHRAYLEYLLTDGGARAYRTDDSVLVAAPRGQGWLVDDAHVPANPWADKGGRDLWNAFDADCHGGDVRLVCPTYESTRTDFAHTAGLRLAESWWLKELPPLRRRTRRRTSHPARGPNHGGRTAGLRPARAILFLPAPTDLALALPASLTEASERGCAAIVVNITVTDADTHTGTDLDAVSAGALVAAEFRRHCDFYTGTIRPL